MHDWRGTPINVGDDVIYYAANAADIVEGTVIGFTESRVRVDITRRRSERVPDEGRPQLEAICAPYNLTVGALPYSSKPLHKQLVREANARL